MKRGIVFLAAVLAPAYIFAQAVPSNPQVIELSLSGPAPGYSATLPQGSAGMATVQVKNNGTGGPMPVGTFTVDVSVDPSKIPFAIGSGPIYDVTSNGGKWTIVNQTPGWVKLRNTNGTIARDETALFELRLAVPANAEISEAVAVLDVSVTGGMGSQALNTNTTPEDDHKEAAIDIVSGTPLPVSLTSFTAVKAGRNALLNWVTATEINNDHFEVERSGNSKDFSRIGVVAGAGNSTGTQKYSLTDEHTLQGVNYYRLKQVDKDGKSVYSDIVPVRFDAEGDIVFYPNPVSDVLTIKGLSGGEQVLVYSALGQKVAEATVKGTATYCSFGHLAPASYTVVVIKNGQRIISKQVIKK